MAKRQVSPSDSSIHIHGVRCKSPFLAHVVVPSVHSSLPPRRYFSTPEINRRVSHKLPVARVLTASCSFFFPVYPKALTQGCDREFLIGMAMDVVVTQEGCGTLDIGCHSLMWGAKLVECASRCTTQSPLMTTRRERGDPVHEYVYDGERSFG